MRERTVEIKEGDIYATVTEVITHPNGLKTTSIKQRDAEDLRRALIQEKEVTLNAIDRLNNVDLPNFIARVAEIDVQLGTLNSVLPPINVVAEESQPQ